LKLRPLNRRPFDTTYEWLAISLMAFTVTVLFHIALNGWFWFFYPGHNWYNDPSTAWIGTYPVDIMHYAIGFSIGAVAFNIDWGPDKRSYMIISILISFSVVVMAGLVWETLEYFIYAQNTTGFIQVALLDTLFDQWMDVFGGLTAVLVGEFFTLAPKRAGIPQVWVESYIPPDTLVHRRG